MTVTLSAEDYELLVETYHAGRLAAMMAATCERPGIYRIPEHYVDRLAKAVIQAEMVPLRYLDATGTP